MKRRWLTASLCCIGLACLMLACTPQEAVQSPDATPHTPPPTPAIDILRVNGASSSGARLRVTVPSVKLLNIESGQDVQLFMVLADPQGTYSYLLYPANRSGDDAELVDLTHAPLEISLAETTTAAHLWVLAVHNTRYDAAEHFGLDSLAASLGFGFRSWLDRGDPDDDPLAAIVDASDRALYEWFAGIEVLGQNMITFEADHNWDIGLSSQRSPDGGLNAVYTVQYISADEVALLPSPTPVENYPGYELRLDETFSSGQSTYEWYEGQDDSTYINRIVDGAYEILLTDIVQREFALSWGSMEEELFEDYIAEAQVHLLESGVTDARYGIWFNYQDDYNFLYFGISNRGQYRIAVILRNANRIEIQDWTTHPAIRRGAATNTLTVQADASGDVTLSINGEPVKTFNDQTFTNGSVAFFCYAESVPATCHLERLRIWEK